MFKKLTQDLLKEVDDSGELKSLSSLYESTRLDVLSVVKIVESRKCLFFKTKRYIPTEFNFQELLPGTDTLDFGEFHEANVATMDMNEILSGKAGVKIPAGSSLCNIEAKGQVPRADSTTEIQLERKSIRLSKLSNRPLNKKHWLLCQMENNKRILGLGVVYEVMKNKNPVMLKRAIKGEGNAKIFIKVASVDAGGAVNSKRQLKLPAGCVLGFKVHPFHLKPKEDSTEKCSMGSDDGRLVIFESGGSRVCGGSGGPSPEKFQLQTLDFLHFGSTQKWSMGSDGVPEFAAEMPDNFPRLQRLVEAELCDFRDMDQSVKELVWKPLYKTLKCPQDLYELDCMLEEGRFSTDTESVRDLLQVVGVDESSESNFLFKPIGFLVSALSELGEEAVTLIVDLDGKARGQVLKLVEGVLEQVYSRDGPLPPMSGQYSENAMKMATQVLTSCGLAVAEDILDPSLGSPGSPDVTLLALYITLKGLDMLLGS